MDEFSRRSQGTEREVELPPRKKGKKGNARGKEAESVEVPPEQFVRVVAVRERSAEDDIQDQVLLSKVDIAAHLQLSDDRLSVTGEKGYRTVRATHGYHSGTFYCEATVQHLGNTGHCRIGWSTKRADLNAPIGYDLHGFSFRDIDGSKFHKALRVGYGAPYGEGDVIGLFIHLPLGGRPLELRTAELLRYKGHLWERVEDEPDPKPLAGTVAGFSKNGVWQGIAFRDFPEGVYYPGVSLYTKPGDSASVSFNFGPEFQYPPPAVEGCPAADPVSVLPAKWAADEAAAAGEASSTADAGVDADAADAEAAFDVAAFDVAAFDVAAFDEAAFDEAAFDDAAADEATAAVAEEESMVGDTGEGPQPVAG